MDMASSEVRHNARSFDVVGTRPVRHDGLDKVTGRARYAADVALTGLLHGKILRSPHAHACIRSIDTSRAVALAGVKAVITARDLPLIDANVPIDFGETRENVGVLARIALADGKVLYRGHAVAAVAAINVHVAEEALELIGVDYEVLPPVLDVLEAMGENAPRLHQSGLTTRIVPERFARGTDTGIVSNVAAHTQFKRGDVERGFREADVVVEREFRTKMVHQGYIEPHASTAYWGPDGHVTIWTSTQGHFGIRQQIGAILQIPESRIKVVPMEIGGGFGGKVNSYLDAVASILSWKSGHPVKITMSRREVFEGTGPASGVFIRCRMGASRAGRITAVEAFMAYEAGAFPGSPMGAGVNTGLAPYRIENLLVDGYDVVVNKPRVAPYRAPGTPQAAFAVESIIDELAEQLGLDPVEFRLRNAARDGDRQPSGVPHGSVGIVQLLETMRDHAHYRAPLGGDHRGRGIAIGYWSNGGLNSSANIHVNPDGTINLISGSPDIGGSRAALAMQAAEVLGLWAEDVNPSVGDTDSIGWTGVTGGSRVAFSTGIAVIQAAENIKEQMRARAALIWDVRPEDVDCGKGLFANTKNPENQFTFRELAGRLLRTGGPISATGTSNPRGVGAGVAGTIVDVEVDPDTGKVGILRATCFQDVGAAMHPSYVEGQMQGGTAQGIGWALNEEYYFDAEGTMVNPTFLDYRMPTSLDLPMIDTVMVTVPNPHHPFGARGVGEVSIVPPVAAIANAVYRATGVRFRSLPISPRTILEGLKTLG
jgi:xanthine dehydrogenase molybdenum-binding subunit